MRSQQNPEMWWSVPFTYAWLYMSFLLFCLICVYSSQFSILFWIMYLLEHFGYLPNINLNCVNYLLFYMKLLNYLFCNMFGSVLECYELTGVSLLWTRWALAYKAKIGFVWRKIGLYWGVYVDYILIVNLKGYFDLLDTSVIVFVNNLLWFVFYFYVICVVELLVSSVICRLQGLSYLHVPDCTSFLLFCLFIIIFIFILNYVPIVTFWIFIVKYEFC